MTRWTIGLLAAAAMLATLVVAVVVFAIVLGQGEMPGEPRADAAARPEQARRPPDRYEWVDRTRGVVRVPIDRAMDVVVERAGSP